MTLKSLTRAMTIASLLGSTTCLLALPAFAETATSPITTPETAYALQQDMLATADEALAMITQVHKARLSLFDDRIDEAKVALETARNDIRTSAADLPAKFVHDFTNADSTEKYLPFDIAMSLTDYFVETPENKLALQQANELMKTAQQDQAINVLRIAAVDMNMRAAMLPYEATLASLDDAIGSIEDGSYFDANLDLKKIEDSVIVRTFGLNSIPQQGDIQ